MAPLSAPVRGWVLRHGGLKLLPQDLGVRVFSAADDRYPFIALLPFFVGVWVLVICSGGDAGEVGGFSVVLAGFVAFTTFSPICVIDRRREMIVYRSTVLFIVPLARRTAKYSEIEGLELDVSLSPSSRGPTSTRAILFAKTIDGRKIVIQMRATSNDQFLRGHIMRLQRLARLVGAVLEWGDSIVEERDREFGTIFRVSRNCGRKEEEVRTGTGRGKENFGKLSLPLDPISLAVLFVCCSAMFTFSINVINHIFGVALLIVSTLGMGLGIYSILYSTMQHHRRHRH